MPWVSVQYVIVVFLDHTHLLLVCFLGYLMAILDLILDKTGPNLTNQANTYYLGPDIKLS